MVMSLVRPHYFSYTSSVRPGIIGLDGSVALLLRVRSGLWGKRTNNLAMVTLVLLCVRPGKSVVHLIFFAFALGAVASLHFRCFSRTYSIS